MRKFVSAWEKFFTGTQVKTIETEGVAADKLFGQLDENAKLIEKMYGVDIAPAPDGICVRGESERVEKIRSRIIDNLSQLPQVEYDRARLEQEMIFYIEKLDINEEKQRLSQHLNYFMETIAAEPGQGKKLGFISQEMGREINTLGSKSNHAEMQKIVVKMKDELEQIKEQVLNVL